MVPVFREKLWVDEIRREPLDLLESARGYFGLGLKEARLIIREVAKVTRGWRAIAVEVGAKASEISRMASAFEHQDLNRALKLK
ncbi:MAG: hypothetical protein KGS00_10685 [Alphaproteobacteria bacterium]|nr:hypothetical protein [Alphaproteobacteria bacterium]